MGIAAEVAEAALLGAAGGGVGVRDLEGPCFESSLGFFSFLSSFFVSFLVAVVVAGTADGGAPKSLPVSALKSLLRAIRDSTSGVMASLED